MILPRRILTALATLSALGVALSGCSTATTSASLSTPTVTLGPTVLSFPGTAINSTSSAQVVTVTNTGTAALTATGVSVSGASAVNFAATTTCGSAVAPGATCTISVTFTPTPGINGTTMLPNTVVGGTSSFQAVVSLIDNAPTSPQTFTVTGTGIAGIINLATPSTLAIAGQLVGTTSVVNSVFVQNTGAGPLTFTSITLGGANAANFTETNNCGTKLASLASCYISVTFTPTVTVAATASITLVDNSAAVPPATNTQVINVTGTGVAPTVTLTASTLTFAAQLKGTTSPVQSVTLTNSGSGTLTLSSITLTGANATSFADTTSCGSTLAAAATCVISTTFTPTTSGALAAAITIVDNATTSPQSIALSGTGTAAGAGLSTASLSFPTSQAVATGSAPQVLTLTNTGNAVLTFTGITITGTNASSFTQTNTCGTSIAAGAACAISVVFTPTAGGALTATLSIADNAPASPQTIPLTGTAVVPVITLSSNSLSYTQETGTKSATQVVMLTNNGPGTLVVGGITLTGTNASLFTETNSCGTSVPAQGNCTITVFFSPAAAGTFTASVSIADNASSTAQTISLSGTGTTTAPVISLSPASLTFTQAAESASTPQVVTLTNSGTAPLLLTGISVAGTNAWNFPMTNTCGTSVAVGANCTISVVFNPSLATGFTGTVAIASNAPVAASVPLTGTGTGTLSINTTTASDWKITNGSITIDWNSTTGNLWGVHLTGYTDNMVDTTTTSNGQPDGLYMDNTGQGAGTVTSGYSQIGNEYIDWWITTASNATTNPFTYTLHYILTANDTGFHIYSAIGHSATDIAGSIGQWQYVFRINLSDFVTTYTSNGGLNNLGVQTVPLPAPAVSGNADPGRQVSNAVVDLHGLTVPAGFTRQFFTKYDYSSYEYLHKEQGVYGSAFGAWMVLPYSGTESMVGGPSKQDLIFTDNILMMEALSNHFALSLGYTPPQGVATNRLFGPFYYHFNAFTTTNTTPASLFTEATTYLPAFNYLYDTDATLASNNYVASTARGAVAPIVYNGGSATANTAWTVLSDNQTNFEYTTQGRQYWVNNNATGTAGITGVVPGTYRLSSYVLGQWGEARQDNVVVTAGNTTAPIMTFTPENFSNYTPIWTIGTPDRSGHEFLHGHDSSGNDLRNFWGSYNFWQDFAATKGTQVYYATASGSTPATNDPTQINYAEWGTFDPGLFGGVYVATDDTTDGYNYVIPAYVNTLTGATGTNGTATPVPPLTIHFTTTAAQLAQGQYTVVSVGVACAEGDIFATLNNSTSASGALIWHAINASDCMVRSGLSGYYQWLVFQFPTSLLAAAGTDNILTLSSNHAEGVVWDAMRMEITNTSAAPGVTGWNDYEFLYGSQYTPANDAVPNP